MNGFTWDRMLLVGVRDTLGSCLCSGTTGELHIIAADNQEKQKE